jgi:hypothetical protein
MIRRLPAWLALVAMALNALWPMLVHATPRGITTEICSVNATSVLAQPELFGADLPQMPVKRTAAHCPFCASWGGSAIPAIAVAWSFVLPVLEAAGFQASPPSPAIIFAVLDGPAPPRAPPAL